MRSKTFMISETKKKKQKKYVCMLLHPKNRVNNCILLPLHTGSWIWFEQVSEYMVAYVICVQSKLQVKWSEVKCVLKTALFNMLQVTTTYWVNYNYNLSDCANMLLKFETEKMP